MSERPIASWEREGDVSFDNDGPGAGIRDGTVTERPQLAPNSRPQRSQKTCTLSFLTVETKTKVIY